MTPQALSTPRFVRRTRLAPNEYRKNFLQIDRDILAAITSEEADAVTPLMSKIYLRLTTAPDKYWEREGVLRVEAEVRDGQLVPAWPVLCGLVGVASATASKALRWMHEQGIVGYFAGKNGVGVRVFLNRAAASIGVRVGPGREKILPFAPASTGAARASAVEAAFNDSFAVKEVLDTDLYSRAPKSGAEPIVAVQQFAEPTEAAPSVRHPSARASALPTRVASVLVIEEFMARLKGELEASLHTAARQAAAREHERTRAWLEQRGLPKAARVAQHEAYHVLRKYGVISEASRSARSEVGRSGYAPGEPRPIGCEEVNELAQACVAMLETQGQALEVTLSKMSAEAGGFLLPEDAERVREQAQALLSAGDGQTGK